MTEPEQPGLPGIVQRARELKQVVDMAVRLLEEEFPPPPATFSAALERMEKEVQAALTSLRQAANLTPDGFTIINPGSDMVVAYAVVADRLETAFVALKSMSAELKEDP